MELELFTSKGGLRPSNSFKPEELAALTPARRILFNRVRETAQALEQTEAAILVATAGLTAAVKKRAECFEALKKVRSPVSAYDAWKAAFRPDLLDVGGRK